MSAQDDLLAAFGEPAPSGDTGSAEPDEVVEHAEVVEDAEATATVEAVEHVEPVELVEAIEPTGVVESVEATEVVEATVAVPEPVEASQQVSAPSDAPPPLLQPQPQPQPQPQQPYLDPAAFFAQLQSESAPPSPKKRRWPRLLLRYTTALVVAGALGAGTAYAITLPKRTDIPYLATPKDGRYTFPPMARPLPPAGKPGPGDRGNGSFTHYNDLRQYLVSVPLGAVPKEDGWEPIPDFDATLTETTVTDQLSDAGLRHVARRGWTMPDGQHTVIELLQFPDHQAAFAVQNALDAAVPAKAGKARTVVPLVTVASFGDDTLKLALRTYDQVDGQPGKTERRLVFNSGDVIAIVTTIAPAGVPDVPTTQVVSLEAQMLR